MQLSRDCLKECPICFRIYNRDFFASRIMRHQRLACIDDWDNRASRARWSVKALAGDCGVSPRSLQRFWRQERREPLAEWLTALRFDYACRLLRSSNVSIEEVARRVHYGHISAFSYAFLARFGITPRQWRRLSVKSSASQFRDRGRQNPMGSGLGVV
jgi:transcriptional regulator GlxA family with amidase domain